MQDTPQEAVAVWTPTAEQVAAANLSAFTDWLARERGLRFADYDALWRWSTTEIEAFWQAAWDYLDVHSPTPHETVLAERVMPGARWFPGARVNFVDQVFRHATTQRPAIVFRGEDGRAGEWSWAELQRQAAALAARLRALGVTPGDRVVAYLPNLPETIVALLGCASVGAVWSVCSPDMGSASVLDRFRQIEPSVLIACNGYRYGGKDHDRGASVAELRAGLPTLRHVIALNQLAGAAPLPDALPWQDAVAGDAPLQAEWLAFDHPLWIVYSSGTTGMPKPIVHGHGGILLVMSMMGMMHNDIQPRDRFHWYSSTGWIMWNAQVGGLLAGATVCLYDGSPAYPDWGALWRFAGETGVTFFGAGAAFFASCEKAGVEPRQIADLSRLRAVGSTGSPLAPESYRWIREHVGAHLWIDAISGGTDFAGAFLAGNVTQPVYEGEMQCRCLGAAVYAYDDAGHPVHDEVGELVCVQPIPSMPLYLWNDDDGSRYRESYFEMYPGVWRHGDWLRVTPRGGAIIYGRSDTTINRQGIRMGTSEIYRAVETLPEVLDSLVVDLEYLGRASYMPLFVVLREGYTLDAALDARIRKAIRDALSGRYVPNEIFAVAQIPRTLSGKKLELPIRKLLLGQPLRKVANPDSLANPASLDWFVAFAQRLNGAADRMAPPPTSAGA
ncbi:acetoacetate--CoA ligase [Verticiella sediminum]|uniref:Acetoacetate--CoA ligase n=1 Tax=Verticiella sediminum TaxID=1247510 RepID=A0A556AB26_9BURK|nr:acetoacetate--CoA ligase [Verticiella sediminum]TSH90083.1 acetoacetate--CoA ligase [Verticiella sediminum]